MGATPLLALVLCLVLSTAARCGPNLHFESLVWIHCCYERFTVVL